jgi:hypothetical protein
MYSGWKIQRDGKGKRAEFTHIGSLAIAHINRITRFTLPVLFTAA